MSTSKILPVLVILLATAGCNKPYFSLMERFGYAKRDLLVSRVDSARQAQDDVKKQFHSALEQFSSVVHFEGGQLEENYKRLDAELKRSEQRAAELRERIHAVEDVAEALFDEWKAELRKYKNTALRDASARELDATRRRYEQLIESMHRAETRLEPALAPLRDNVLFLKHNLNARAIRSLDQETVSIRNNVEVLIRDLDRAIAESERFIREMKAQK